HVPQIFADAEILHDAQPLFKARLLDLEIGVEVRHLLAQRHAVLDFLQRAAHEFREAKDQPLRARRLLLAADCGDGVQRVVKKMRVDLGLEKKQLRAQQILFQLAAALLAQDRRHDREKQKERAAFENGEKRPAQ